MKNVSNVINNMKIRERKNGGLEGRTTVNGKRKSFYGKTKVEVKQKAKAYLVKVENGFKEPQKITLDEYMQYWLQTYKLNKIEPTSYSRLCSVYFNQIQEVLGDKKIGSITRNDIQKIIDEYANPTKNGTKPLALSGLKKILHLLSPCFKTAVIEGVIGKNPCEDIILPKESCIQTKTKKQFSLNDDEINQFKEATLSTYKTTGEYVSRDAFVLLIILNLGLRANEATALLWTDVNMEEKYIRINKTVQSNIKDYFNNDTKIKRKIKNATKTNEGRIISLNENVLEYLRILIAYDTRNNIHSEYVACTHKGTMQIERNLQRSLDRIIKMTNINKKVTLHTLRHTFGSVLLRRGVNIEIISKLMGHANISITYNKYIHTIQEEEAKAMQMVKVC